MRAFKPRREMVPHFIRLDDKASLRFLAALATQPNARKVVEELTTRKWVTTKPVCPGLLPVRIWSGAGAGTPERQRAAPSSIASGSWGRGFFIRRLWWLAPDPPASAHSGGGVPAPV